VIAQRRRSLISTIAMLLLRCLVIWPIVMWDGSPGWPELLTG